MTKHIQVYRILQAEYALESLATGKLKVGRVADLNDPYDCRPFIDDNDETNKYHLDRLHQKVGLLSFTTDGLDPSMWSRYGGNHTGIALGFNLPMSNNFFKMNYTDNRPALSNLENYDTAELIEILSSEFKDKAKSWIKESEYRMWFNLDRCAFQAPHYFTDEIFMSLNEILLGEKCKYTRHDIKRALKSGGHSREIPNIPDDRIYHLKKSTKTFQMTKEESDAYNYRLPQD